MIAADVEEGKNKNKHENVVYAQAPFHQVSAHIFQCGLMTFFPRQESIKSKCQRYPEKRLVQRFSYTDLGGRFTEQTQFENKCQQCYNAKYQLRKVIRRHCCI